MVINDIFFQILVYEEFWQKKIERNIQRDIEVNNYLESQNWKVLRFWSHEIEKNLEESVAKIQSEIILRQNQVC
nr:DUF559 domain-containing protein [uncultured Flavobacterium sp.]